MPASKMAKKMFAEQLTERENALRLECTDLIDDVYLAFKRTGRSDEEFTAVQWYEHHLYRALNGERLTFVERFGALKVIRRYLMNLRDGFNSEAPDGHMKVAPDVRRD